jgi:nucleotide-binding universal stress UspA family protein
MTARQRAKNDDPPTSADHIVVGVDGSPESCRALTWAIDYANKTGVKVRAITCWQIPIVTGWAMPSALNPKKMAEQTLTNAIVSVCGHAPIEGLRRIAREGNPAKILIDASDDAQMLIVGSRGHGGFAELLIGSVSSACAEHAHCPVLVVR